MQEGVSSNIGLQDGASSNISLQGASSTMRLQEEASPKQPIPGID